jgi:hypothetical protein
VSFHRSVTPGYERARVLNPWVFANYGQPQRLRGYVSPVVFQTRASMPGSPYLGATDDVSVPLTSLIPPLPLGPASSDPEEPIRIMRRMQVLSVLSVTIGAMGLLSALRRK